jgi:hypothetical protein
MEQYETQNDVCAEGDGLAQAEREMRIGSSDVGVHHSIQCISLPTSIRYLLKHWMCTPGSSAGRRCGHASFAFVAAHSPLWSSMFARSAGLEQRRCRRIDCYVLQSIHLRLTLLPVAARLTGTWPHYWHHMLVAGTGRGASHLICATLQPTSLSTGSFAPPHSHISLPVFPKSFQSALSRLSNLQGHHQ